MGITTQERTVPPVRKPTANEQVLLDFLGCDPAEVRKHSETVYEWRGLYFEVLTAAQRRRSKVPASWYSQWETKFYARQMGKKAAKVQKIIKKK